jgi:hypothetical protein
MSIPVLPPPFDQIGNRRFSFYPAIVGIEHNEWTLRKATWSEVLVANSKNAEEIWIPRRFIGEVSRTDEPVMILGLVKEVEYKAGQVIPHIRRIIEMPKAVNDAYRPAVATEVQAPAPVVGIRLDSGAERRIGRLILWALGLGTLMCLAVVVLFRADRNPRINYTAVLQSEIGLNPSDDYFAVLRQLGTPAADRWRSDEGTMQYRVLDYPDRGFSVVLMGAEREKALYIGAVDRNWRIVDSVTLRGGTNTAALLRALRP